jgi:hypothetical protein
MKALLMGLPGFIGKIIDVRAYPSPCRGLIRGVVTGGTECLGADLSAVNYRVYIRSVMGFRQFFLRWVDAVKDEWDLCLIAFNFKWLNALTR